MCQTPRRPSRPQVLSRVLFFFVFTFYVPRCVNDDIGKPVARETFVIPAARRWDRLYIPPTSIRPRTRALLRCATRVMDYNRRFSRARRTLAKDGCSRCSVEDTINRCYTLCPRLFPQRGTQCDGIAQLPPSVPASARARAARLTGDAIIPRRVQRPECN